MSKPRAGRIPATGLDVYNRSLTPCGLFYPYRPSLLLACGVITGDVVGGFVGLLPSASARNLSSSCH